MRRVIVAVRERLPLTRLHNFCKKKLMLRKINMGVNLVPLVYIAYDRWKGFAV